MSRIIHVVGAVILRDGLVMAAQRGAGQSMAGMWEFPGGKIEPGETPEQSLARELREELLVEVEVGDFVARSDYDYSFGTVRLDAYVCRLVSGQPQLTEHEAVGWFTPEELAGLDWAPADVPVVVELEKLLSAQGR
ncbi:(deoxy)nucleoside triphosphate pyrophosphohydrolase [Trueperella bialowiezensis]|uniref:8-oxo-dGTP diphosphatase n=1 Tax=Trueperella bialowiezensis TaxID=312285 RepID=A0A3S4WGS3_9ACTO|nr:(deoxy)nucleoside triphosphate pyrophosphohydrolase [Trueperella bialowiezensis]VEI13569.1 CTP pyrophosphohydrolase [Trueperella bialowiezensis]